MRPRNRLRQRPRTPISTGRQRPPVRRAIFVRFPKMISIVSDGRVLSTGATAVTDAAALRERPQPHRRRNTGNYCSNKHVSLISERAIRPVSR